MVRLFYSRLIVLVEKDTRNDGRRFGDAYREMDRDESWKFTSRFLENVAIRSGRGFRARRAGGEESQ